MNKSEEKFVDRPPEHLPSDFIEIAYLLIVIAIGTPSNIYILIKLCRSLKQTRSDSVKVGFLILKINLNISDLLILTILAFGKLCWLITYEWRGGDLLCKLFNFLSMIALYISSNIVVCIALDRLRNVLGASKIRGRKSTNFVRLIVAISWILSVIWSIPQLWVWTILNVYPEHPGGWTQCSDVWSIKRYQSTHQILDNTTDLTQNVYNILHLVLVFWGPFLILVICYVFIAIRLLHYTITDPCQQAQKQRNKLASMDNVQKMLSEQSPNQALKMSMSSSDMLCLDRDNRAGQLTRKSTDDMSSRRVSVCTSDSVYSGSRFCGTLCRKEKSQNTYDSPRKRRISSRNIKAELTRTLRRISKNDTAKDLRVPSWRRQLRNRVFRTTLLVVLTHILFWFPYNLYSIMKYVNTDLYLKMSDHANVFKDLEILITLINPFLYGFT